MSKLIVHRRVDKSESGHQWFALYQENNLPEVIESVFYNRVQALLYIKGKRNDKINTKLD